MPDGSPHEREMAKEKEAPGEEIAAREDATKEQENADNHRDEEPFES